jgi:type IV pilus assembly protein PilW
MRATPKFSRGFSLIELMVAMVIGLIGVIIIFQVFEASEGVRRTTSSGGDAQQNGAISLYLMERDLRNAGMGFNDTTFAGCNITGSDTQRAPNAFPTAPATMPLVPVLITPGAAATTPDQLTVAYGSQSQVAASTDLTQAMGAATDALRVRNRYGFRTGDLMLVVDPTGAVGCSLMEVTSLPTGLQADQVFHASGSYTLANGNTVTARFNPAAGLGILYGAPATVNAARVFNIGNLYDANNAGLPIYNTYAIVNNSLTVSNAFVVSAGVPTVNPIADNVVHMRAQYGVDDGVGGGTAGDGRVDRYINTPPNWQYVIAVRLAVVARSALPERPSGGAGAACDTTTDGTAGTPDLRPTWSGGVFDVSAAVAAPDDWKCYRYRVFETTVPLRNWIWKSS